jgi:hypothetical protein
MPRLAAVFHGVLMAATIKLAHYLFVALRALRELPNPPQSDIDAIATVLREQYGEHLSKAHLWHAKLFNERDPARGLQVTWRDIWSGITAGGRAVTVQEADDGSIRVRTTTRERDAGAVVEEEGSHAIISPSAAGSPLDIEPDDGESIEDALMEQGGFSAEEAADIAQHVEDQGD